MKSRLKFHLYERFCELRTSELFDIIKLFPDSRPALLDFRTALERTHQQKKIIRSLQGVLQRRLLHPGANTSQIIDIYVATIKTLKILDPTGILLESISEPIKDYLRGRHDTVRCIVGSLTDDTSSDLFEELGVERQSQLSMTTAMRTMILTQIQAVKMAMTLAMMCIEKVILRMDAGPYRC